MQSFHKEVNSDNPEYINLREVVYMSKLKTVNEIRVNGKWIREEELDPAFVQRVINDRIDFAMTNQGFVRKDKTA